jgi:hypothetical protein
MEQLASARTLAERIHRLEAAALEASHYPDEATLRGAFVGIAAVLGDLRGHVDELQDSAVELLAWTAGLWADESRLERARQRLKAAAGYRSE